MDRKYKLKNDDGNIYIKVNGSFVPEDNKYSNYKKYGDSLSHLFEEIKE